MKYLSVLFIMFSFSCCAQNCQQKNYITPNELIGIWQADNNEESSAWFDVYRFFDNGKFIFNPNQYDGLKRVLSITGKYRIVDNYLYLKINSTTEIVGGYIVRSTITVFSDSWEIEGGEIKEFEHPNIDEEVVKVQQYQIDASNEISIILDNRKYYKMQSDPTKY
ncbi:MAG: hypothetical protein U1C46_05260 [Bacteroidales bacterium]|nr:hypothetical protein [Bacteroidales bacterium]